MNSYSNLHKRLKISSYVRLSPSWILWLLLGCMGVHAQSGIDATGTGGNNAIKGRIYLPSGPLTDVRLKVRLESTDMANLSTITDVNGAFTFGGLQAGNYTIIIEGDKSYETYREPVTIDRQGTRSGASARILTLPIYLRPKISRDPAASPGTIDASLATVPPPALDLYNKGLEALKKGDSRAAVEHLKAAVSLHPEFALALNELGVQYLKLGQPDKAVEVLRAALKITPNSFTPRLNYGIALLETKEFAKGESELRQALKANDGSAVAHLYLGITLVKQRKLDDGEKELRRAADSGRSDMSLAHYYLGGIYWGRQDYKRAADALETYLKLAPQAPDAERIRATIKELRSHK